MINLIFTVTIFSIYIRAFFHLNFNNRCFCMSFPFRLKRHVPSKNADEALCLISYFYKYNESFRGLHIDGISLRFSEYSLILYLTPDVNLILTNFKQTPIDLRRFSNNNNNYYNKNSTFFKFAFCNNANPF